MVEKAWKDSAAVQSSGSDNKVGADIVNGLLVLVGQKMKAKKKFREAGRKISCVMKFTQRCEVKRIVQGRGNIDPSRSRAQEANKISNTSMGSNTSIYLLKTIKQSL